MPEEPVALVRQRVRDQVVLGEFQDVKLCMGCDELCYDASVGESGMLDFTVQAVLVTNVIKAKTVIKQACGTKPRPPALADTPANPELEPFSRSPLPRGSRTGPAFTVHPLRQFMLAVDVLAEVDCDSEDSRKLLEDLSNRDFYSLELLAHVATKVHSPTNALRSIRAGLTYCRRFNVFDANGSAVWIELIHTSAARDGDHDEHILCPLASFHPAAAVRAAALRAFGLALVWAVRHIRALKQIAQAVEGDPDDFVRDAAATSAKALEDALARGRLPPSPTAVGPAPPSLRGPPARRIVEDGSIAEEEQLQRSQEEDSQISREEDLQTEQRDLQEAILRSKADALSADGMVLTRLTLHSRKVMSFLSQADELARCRYNVESAGCSVQPAWANGALLLVPVTEQQIIEADIQLKPHSILMLASDEQLVRDTLAQPAKRKRPVLRPEHYPHGKEHVPTHPESTNFQTQFGPQEFQSAEGAASQVHDIGALRSGAHFVGLWM